MVLLEIEQAQQRQPGDLGRQAVDAVAAEIELAEVHQGHQPMRESGQVQAGQVQDGKADIKARPVSGRERDQREQRERKGAENGEQSD